MSHLSDLEAQYDGPIPRELRTAAIAADRRAQARRRTKPAKSPKTVLLKPVSDTFLIVEMAMAMVTRTRDYGACTEADLWQVGYTPAQITRFGERARAVALELSRDVA